MALFTPLIRAPAEAAVAAEEAPAVVVAHPAVLAAAAVAAVAEAPVVVAPAAMAAVAEAAAAAEDNSIRIINRLKSKKIGLTHAKASP